MKVIVNKEQMELPEQCSVARMLELTGVDTAGIAVAVDNKVVSRSAWADTMLTEGNVVTIIRAVCGG